MRYTAVVLVIFTAHNDIRYLALRRRYEDRDRPATNAAIFDILLFIDRTIDQHFDGLPAVWALYRYAL